MGPFLPLFSIEVEHSFFPDDRCRGLRFTPTPDSVYRLERARCLLRATDRGVIVLHDASALPVLRSVASDADQALRIDFLVRAADPLFANYTERLADAPASVPVFDSTQAVADGGRWHLHAGAGAAAMLARRDLLAPPAFVVSITVTPEDLAAPAPQGKSYCCHLHARTTVWKYCLLGVWAEQAEDPPQVVDLAQACHFEAPVAESLVDGQHMLAVRSSTRIPLQQKSDRRFQLRQRSGNADRVLIKRLPVASARHLSRETLGGEATFVSEIHVHR
jgi:hypothetical protein